MRAFNHEKPWKVSLHGGHSGDFCEHAEGSLREILEAAVKENYHTFGVTEHAPRLESRFLYPDELEKGFTVEKLVSDFEQYHKMLSALVEEFSDRIVILRSFEAEIIPSNSYVKVMKGYKEKYTCDYMLGSVHYVNDIIIDLGIEPFERALEMHGGLDSLAIRYYETVARMVEELRPDVVGHFDLIRRYGHQFGSVDTPGIRKMAEEALQVVKEYDCILDLNTSGYRKGLGGPYPAPWILDLANRMGVGFCFGDDSHSPIMVGAGVEEARDYLLQNGIKTVTVLTKESGNMVKKIVPL